MTVDLLLLERLSDADLALLAQAAGEAGPKSELAPRLRRHPGGIEPLLARPEVFAALFDDHGADPLVLVSPFAAFAVLVARATETLRGMAFVPERIGRRTTVPVFEVESLRSLLEDPLRRLFLADLLASYSHVASGGLWMRGRRGWSHRRFSELDPAQLAELAILVPPHERAAVYRRFGDLALFLAGVFPDYVEAHPLPPVAVERIQRVLAGGEWRPPDVAVGGHVFDLGSIGFLESAGGRAYRLALAGVTYPELGLAPALGYVAGEFGQARIVLNFITDSYLGRLRGRLFPLGGA